MRLTDYYKLEKLPNSISKERMDCVASTGSYDLIEETGMGKRGWLGIKMYFSNIPPHFKAHNRRKADKILSFGSKNFSSVYFPNINYPTFGFGDVEKTQDGLLFLFNKEFTQVEIFVARGLKNSISNLFNLFLDGELEEEINNIRKIAKPVN